MRKELLSAFVIAICSTGFGCSRKSDEIGKHIEKYEIECVKTQSHLGVGITSSGKTFVSANDSCLVSACFKKIVLTGKHFWDDEEISSQYVGMDICISKRGGN